jgi:hypothetical protein
MCSSAISTFLELFTANLSWEEGHVNVIKTAD